MILRSAAVSLAVVGLLASGCSQGDAKPRSLPTLKPSHTPSLQSNAVEVPPAARSRSVAGADAFVRFFFTRLNIAFRESAPEILVALSNSECATCKTYESALAATRGERTFLNGDSFTIIDVAAAPLQSRGTLVEVFGTVPARERVDDVGKVVERLATTGNFHFTVAVKWVDDRWLVSGIRPGS